MNLFHLSSSDLLTWGFVIHLVADWPLQSDWMAKNKMNLRHLAGYVHAGIHGVLFAVIFGWVAIPLALAHLLIDTRKPVAWWSKVMRQAQPHAPTWIEYRGMSQGFVITQNNGDGPPLMDMGLYVRMMMDQVFHILCVAVAALAVTL